jgi:hypothetical protein
MMCAHGCREEKQQARHAQQCDGDEETEADENGNPNGKMKLFSNNLGCSSNLEMLMQWVAVHA